jgi:hypothetical protein
MRPSPLLALFGVAGLVAIASAASGEGAPDMDPERPEPPPFPPAIEKGETQALVREMATALGLDTGWIAFLEAAAMGESGFNPLAARGVQRGAPEWVSVRHDVHEADAAERAFARNKSRYYAGCPWPDPQYTFGSGGLWAMLPANALAAFKGHEQICMSPWSVFEPAPAIVMILEYCRRVMRYDAFKATPTWGNLRNGMGAISLLGKESALENQRTKKNKLGDRLEQLGYDRALVDATVTPLPPKDPIGWLQIVESIG